MMTLSVNGRTLIFKRLRCLHTTGRAPTATELKSFISFRRKSSVSQLSSMKNRSQKLNSITWSRLLLRTCITKWCKKKLTTLNSLKRQSLTPKLRRNRIRLIQSTMLRLNRLIVNFVNIENTRLSKSSSCQYNKSQWIRFRWISRFQCNRSFTRSSL